MGHGSTSSVYTPKKIEALNDETIAQFAHNKNNSAAVTADGKLYTWGLNGNVGTLGLGFQLGSKDTPQLVTYFIDNDIKIKQVSIGLEFMYALTEDGKLYSWGDNRYGKLGYGSSYTQYATPTPKKVKVLDSYVVKEVQAYFEGVCVLLEDGRMMGWGYNFEGNLGISNTTTPIYTRH